MNAVVSQETSALALPATTGYDYLPTSFDEAWQYSQMLANSDLVPKDFRGKPENCFLAMAWGREIGLRPMSAIQNIAVINGRPSLWGDVMLALVRASALCEYVTEEIFGDKAICRAKRRGQPEQVREFTRQDAETAGLWSKAGPWQQYPKRMLQMRARAWALRDVFTDLLKGLHMAEEAMDMPKVTDMGMVDEVRRDTPAPTAAPAAEAYPDDKFESNFAQWEGVIKAKRKTHASMIAFIEAKGQKLSEMQKAKINSIQVPLVEDVTPKPTAAPKPEADPFTAPKYSEIADKIVKAKDMDALATAGDMIRHVADLGQQAELQAKFEAREQELRG